MENPPSIPSEIRKSEKIIEIVDPLDVIRAEVLADLENLSTHGDKRERLARELRASLKRIDRTERPVMLPLEVSLSDKTGFLKFIRDKIKFVLEERKAEHLCLHESEEPTAAQPAEPVEPEIDSTVDATVTLRNHWYLTATAGGKSYYVDMKNTPSSVKAGDRVKIRPITHFQKAGPKPPAELITA